MQSVFRFGIIPSCRSIQYVTTWTLHFRCSIQTDSAAWLIYYKNLEHVIQQVVYKVFYWTFAKCCRNYSASGFVFGTNPKSLPPIPSSLLGPLSACFQQQLFACSVKHCNDSINYNADLPTLSPGCSPNNAAWKAINST